MAVLFVSDTNNQIHTDTYLSTENKRGRIHFPTVNSA